MQRLTQAETACGNTVCALDGATVGTGKDKYEEYLREANNTQTWWSVVVAELPDLLMDLTGINDVKDCFTNFDILACVSPVPAAKAFKIVSSPAPVC